MQNWDEAKDNAPNSLQNRELTWSVSKFAQIMHISMPTAYAMTEEPGFPLLRVGRKKLVVISGIEQWLANRGLRCCSNHTDEENNKARCNPELIKKALKTCAAGLCFENNCPYKHDKTGLNGDWVCRQNLEFDALEYIEMLEGKR